MTLQCSVDSSSSGSQKEVDSTLQNHLQGHASHLLTTLFSVAKLHEMFKPYPQFLDYKKYLVSSF